MWQKKRKNYGSCCAKMGKDPCSIARLAHICKISMQRQYALRVYKLNVSSYLSHIAAAPVFVLCLTNSDMLRRNKEKQGQ